MNTAMAPIDPHQLSLEDLRRRHGLVEDISSKQKRAGDGEKRDGGIGEGPGNSKPKYPSPNVSSGEKGGDSSRNKGKGDDGEADNNGSSPTASPGTVPLPPPPPPSIQQVGTGVTSPTTFLAPAAVTTAPTTIIIISTPTPSPAVISSTPTLPSSNTIFTSLIPTTSSLYIQPTLPSVTPTQSEPRDGVNTDRPPNFTSVEATSSPSIVGSTPTGLPPSAVPEVAGSFSTTLAVPSHTPEPGRHGGKFNGIRKQKGNRLSPTAEGLLIAVGVIGAIIIIVAGILLILRMKKIDAFSKFRNRKIRRGGNRDLYGWRRDDQYSTDAPPKYPGEAEVEPYSYPHDEKSIPAERQMNGFFSPVSLPPLSIPAATLSRGAQEQTQSPRALPNNPSPSTYIPSPQEGPISTTQAFYNISPRTQNDLSRQISDANQTMRSENTFASHQTSNIHEPSQNQVGHMSYLSSLSSGFGDGLIMLEGSTNPNSRQTYRQSQSQSQNPATANRFSWARSQSQGQGQRDTVYTTTSEESAPRFRSVTSWVAQQTGRVQVEKQQKVQGQVPNVPALPVQVHAGLNHQRNISEDPVFKFHPGEEIQISRGSRVPSVVLNKKTGIR